MHNQKFVFAQIVAFLDKEKFRYIVQVNEGDKYIKHPEIKAEMRWRYKYT